MSKDARRHSQRLGLKKGFRRQAGRTRRRRVACAPPSKVRSRLMNQSLRERGRRICQPPSGAQCPHAALTARPSLLLTCRDMPGGRRALTGEGDAGAIPSPEERQIRAPRIPEADSFPASAGTPVQAPVLTRLTHAHARQQGMRSSCRSSGRGALRRCPARAMSRFTVQRASCAGSAQALSGTLRIQRVSAVLSSATTSVRRNWDGRQDSAGDGFSTSTRTTPCLPLARLRRYKNPSPRCCATGGPGQKPSDPPTARKPRSA